MKNILIYGDSNTWGYDVTRFVPELNTCRRMTEAERWPGLVRRALGAGCNVIEDALNGRTNVQEDPYSPIRNGLKGLLIALDAHAPLDLVAIHLGCNELKHMYNLSAGMIARGAEALVQACGRSLYGYPAPRVLLIAPAPTRPDIGELRAGYNFGPLAYEKSRELGRWYRAVAERNGCGFIDCADLHFTLNDLDGLHYSKADHAKLAAAAERAIREMLG
ncbi:MAG: GDSL family lipase [Clostridia bacterium]|nr:GDSL family lipase [Clostridia bacterium]